MVVLVVVFLSPLDAGAVAPLDRVLAMFVLDCAGL